MAHVAMTNIMNVVMTNHTNVVKTNIMSVVDSITIIVIVSAIVVAPASIWQQPAPCIAVIPILICVLCLASCMQRPHNKAPK